jgi:hypothetical protein
LPWLTKTLWDSFSKSLYILMAMMATAGSEKLDIIAWAPQVSGKEGKDEGKAV